LLRQEGVPRTFEEICAVSPIHNKGIDVCMKLILQERNISLDSYPTPDFIPRFCGNLSKYYSKISMIKRKNKFNS
jgi:transcription initiation factor TFIIIB Brf1 subunit/transcription initiation factor TFIIB